METSLYFAYVAIVSRLLPLGMGIRRWRVIGPAGRLLVAFVGLSLAGDVIGGIILGRVLGLNNQWISHFLIAVQTPILVLAFSEWAASPRMRRALRYTAVAAIVAWIVLTLGFETLTRFARVTGPLQAALFCVVAATVLIRRALAAESPLGSSDWFFVCIGVLLVYSLTAVYRPLLDLSTTKGIVAIPAWTVLRTLSTLQTIANLLYTRALYVAGRTSARAVPAVA